MKRVAASTADKLAGALPEVSHQNGSLLMCFRAGGVLRSTHLRFAFNWIPVMPPSRFMPCSPGMLQRLRNSFLGGEGRRKPARHCKSELTLALIQRGMAACKVACKMLWIQSLTKFSDGCLLQRLVKTHPAVRSWPELVVKDLCNYVTIRGEACLLRRLQTGSGVRWLKFHQETVVRRRVHGTQEPLIF